MRNRTSRDRGLLMLGTRSHAHGMPTRRVRPTRSSHGSRRTRMELSAWRWLLTHSRPGLGREEGCSGDLGAFFRALTFPDCRSSYSSGLYTIKHSSNDFVFHPFSPAGNCPASEMPRRLHNQHDTGKPAPLLSAAYPRHSRLADPNRREQNRPRRSPAT